MNRHPGGEAQTLHLLENIEWKKEMKALDLGAGEGDTVRILKSFGLEAHGVDLFPRGSDVETGDLVNTDLEDEDLQGLDYYIECVGWHFGISDYVYKNIRLPEEEQM